MHDAIVLLIGSGAYSGFDELDKESENNTHRSLMRAVLGILSSPYSGMLIAYKPHEHVYSWYLASFGTIKLGRILIPTKLSMPVSVPYRKFVYSCTRELQASYSPNVANMKLRLMSSCWGANCE